MNARLRKLVSDLREAFWFLPALMVLGAFVAALGLVALDRSGMVPRRLIEGSWLYDGGGTGARTLLGVVASSTIGLAGTVFSITIAALTLAAGQMGPRLLRNFVRDRGNQFTLGAFLGTFTYALMVLRSVRTQAEGEFIPHLSLSVGILLAFVCVATLVYFVGHMSGRINVDTVIELVSDDVRAAMERMTAATPQPEPPPEDYWRNATPVPHAGRGYLQQLDESSLAGWAAAHGTAIRLLVRPGDYVFPGIPIAQMTVPQVGAEEAIRAAMAFGANRGSSADPEFAVRQLVEVAVRALSPGINDPYTAMSVLDRLGAALCEVAPMHLVSGVTLVDGRTALVVPVVSYDGLVDSMFHMIRQHARGKAAVLIRMLEVLAAVAGCEREHRRNRALLRHADLVLGDAERSIDTPDDLSDVRRRYAGFASQLQTN